MSSSEKSGSQRLLMVFCFLSAASAHGGLAGFFDQLLQLGSSDFYIFWSGAI